MPLEPGRTLGHYRIDRQIGRGGMGEVFLAEDTKLDRKVALKILPSEMAADPDRLARFQREARTVAALNHPHIVTLFSVEEDRGTHFLTMELIEGESLNHTLPPGGLPLAQVFDIGIALADALAAAHEKGIIHRDLKPANVMVTNDGRVKVLDFGLAKQALGPARATPEISSAPTERVAAPDSLTAAGMVMGTVPYMSPEQVKGESVDARTDIFSLGVLLYELATGQRPFAGRSPAETISSILRDAPRPVTAARPDAPRHLASIIEHCLRKDPEARFQTVRDVRSELRNLCRAIGSGQPALSDALATPSLMASATAPAPSGTKKGASGSRAWLWAVGGAVVVGVVAFLWLAGRRSSEPGTGGEHSTGATAPAAGGVAVAETNSLAVLPFTNMSSDKEQEYFSDGLTEELLNVLARIPELKVAGRTSSFSFKGKNEDLRTIGEKLGVANILEGSVRKSRDKIRITAQLVKAADGFHIWSESYDRTLDDIFAVQDDIAGAVAAALKVTLLGKGAAAKNPNAEAYDLVLQARFVMQKRTEETIRRAREMMERALALSPDYAPAWAEMGLAHLNESGVAATVEETKQARERARMALARALELDPNLAVAHSRLASVQRASWDFAAAERSTARALAAEPRNPIVMGNAAVLYVFLGRLDEAIVLAERAHVADPLALSAFTNLANYYLLAGRLDEAEALCRQALEMAPEMPNAHGILGDIHLLRGEAEAARKSYVKKAAELSGQNDYDRLWSDAMVEYTAGNAAASQAAALEYEKRFGNDDPKTAATIRAWRGEADAAFTWLDKALAARDPSLASIKTDIYLRSLHPDPRWNALLKKIGLPTD